MVKLEGGGPKQTGLRERQFLEMTCCLKIFGSH